MLILTLATQLYTSSQNKTIKPITMVLNGVNYDTSVRY